MVPEKVCKMVVVVVCVVVHFFWLVECLWNDLFCVEWEVKLQLSQSIIVCVCVCSFWWSADGAKGLQLGHNQSALASRSMDDYFHLVSITVKRNIW